MALKSYEELMVHLQQQKRKGMRWNGWYYSYFNK